MTGRPGTRSIQQADDVLVELKQRGACAGLPTDIFYPVKGPVSDTVRAVCKSCSVRDKCLLYALEHGEHGYWGGTSEKDRNRLFKQRRAVL